MESVCREAAEAEFERFCDQMDLDFDESRMRDDKVALFGEHREKFVRAVMRGKLSINEQGEPVYRYAKPGDGDEIDIVFREPKLKALQAGDKAKEDAPITKAVLTMAAQTGVASNIFLNMGRRDYEVCVAVTSLFFP